MIAFQTSTSTKGKISVACPGESALPEAEFKIFKTQLDENFFTVSYSCLSVYLWYVCQFHVRPMARICLITLYGACFPFEEEMEVASGPFLCIMRYYRWAPWCFLPCRSSKPTTAKPQPVASCSPAPHTSRAARRVCTTLHKYRSSK